MFVKALLVSRKFWLTVGACVAAVVTGQPHLIPVIILTEIGAITIEDAAQKFGLKSKPND